MGFGNNTFVDKPSFGTELSVSNTFCFKKRCIQKVSGILLNFLAESMNPCTIANI